MADLSNLKAGIAVTPEQREYIEQLALEAIANNPHPTLFGIAKEMGVNYWTLYQLVDRHPAFGERIKAAMQVSERAAVDSVLEQHFKLGQGKSKRGNVLAQIHILKNRDKRYREDRKQGPTITINIDKAQIALAQSSAANVDQLAAGEEDE